MFKKIFLILPVVALSLTACSSSDSEQKPESKAPLVGNVQIIATSALETGTPTVVKKNVNCQDEPDFCEQVLAIHKETEAMEGEDASTLMGCQFSYAVVGIIDGENIEYNGDCNITTKGYGPKLRAAVVDLDSSWEGLTYWEPTGDVKVS